jgi:peptide/nickel transport system substrate-binding protein
MSGLAARGVRWFGVAAACASMLAGLSGVAQAQGTPKQGGTLVFGINAGDPPTYDCHASALFNVVQTMSPFYSTLLRLDMANYPKVVGDLAETWTVNPEKTLYTFKLRANVKFHDGSTLTAEDVKASFDRIRNPPPGIASVRKNFFTEVEAIDTPDGSTVVFRMKRPQPAFLFTVANPGNCVYSAAKLKQDPRFPELNVLGTGAFMFASHTAGSNLEGKRFDGYYRQGLPYLDGFRAQFVSGPALINAIQSGQVLTEFRGLSPADRDRLKQAAGDRLVVHELPWGTNTLITYNTKKPPFDDARVRRALSMAVDRWQASQVLSRTTNLKAVGGIQRPGSELSASDDELAKMPGFSRDIAAARAEARKLLADAGHPNLKFKLSNRAAPQNPFLGAAIYLIDQWRQIGVEVEHVPLQDTAYNTSLSEGTFDLVLDFQTDFVDEPDFSYSRFLSADISGNRARYVDRKADEMIARQSSLSDDTVARRKALREIETHLLSEAYMVPFLWWHRIILHDKSIKGWNMGPTHVIGQDLTEVWLDK